MTYQKVDFIVLGQGLCGTLLSRQLLQAGKSVLVIDNPAPNTSSKVASGIINPVTGRRIVRTWRIEELLPFALKEYRQIEEELNVALLTETSIIDFYASLQIKEAFDKRLAEETDYLQQPTNLTGLTNFFRFNYGAGQISPCLLVDVNQLLQSWRSYLNQQGLLLQTMFGWSDCVVEPNRVRYKNITAQAIICCEGVEGFSNPYFKNLPYTPMKGEALIAQIPALPRGHIYKQGISLVPWGNDRWWIGSTYEWYFDNLLPTPAWRKKVEEQLKYWLRLPFTITDHLAANRPANMERRPFVGVHPQHSSVGILNGMGAKGCSLAPFFAAQLANRLINNTPIYADADVQRFAKILARNMQ